MAKIDERLVRKTYSEIVAGYTVSRYNSKYVFIKHFSSISLLEFDYKYESALKEAIDKGVPTEEEKINFLIADGSWSKKQDELISDLKESIRLMDFNKKKHYAPREIKNYNDQIKLAQSDLIDLLTKKQNLIGATAENFARKRVDTAQVFSSFYLDANLLEKVFGDEDYDSMDNDEINEILATYYSSINSVSHNNIRLAALSSDFQNMYSMAADLYQFYGKPISALTHNQLILANYGNYYKHILGAESKPPEELMDNPDDLEDWFSGKRNLDEILNKYDNAEDGKTISIMGVNKKDLAFYGVESG